MRDCEQPDSRWEILDVHNWTGCCPQQHPDRPFRSARLASLLGGVVVSDDRSRRSTRLGMTMPNKVTRGCTNESAFHGTFGERGIGGRQRQRGHREEGNLFSCHWPYPLFPGFRRTMRSATNGNAADRHLIQVASSTLRFGAVLS